MSWIGGVNSLMFLLHGRPMDAGGPGGGAPPAQGAIHRALFSAIDATPLRTRDSSRHLLQLPVKTSRRSARLPYKVSMAIHGLLAIERLPPVNASNRPCPLG